jgi:anti-anti-sigma factor
MKIKTQDYNDVTVIEIQGEFVAEYVKLFTDTAKGIVEQGSAGIVLDMSSVVFIDSQSLEATLSFNDYCQEHTRQLKLAGLDDNCMKILEMTRLLNRLDCYAELAEAVKSFV